MTRPLFGPWLYVAAKLRHGPLTADALVQTARSPANIRTRLKSMERDGVILEVRGLYYLTDEGEARLAVTRDPRPENSTEGPQEGAN